MSLGYTGICHKVAEDEHIVIYTYAGENWNDGGKSKLGDSQLQDGIFTIQKDSFCANLERSVQTKSVEIKQECKNAFRKANIPCDYIAWRLLNHIFDYTKTNHLFPDRISFIQ